MAIPFLPLSEKTAKRLARHYLGWGESISRFFPSLASDLEIAGITMEDREWLGLGFYGSIIYGLAIFIISFTVLLSAGIRFPQLFGIPFAVSMGLGVVIMMYFVFYPKLKSKRRVRDIENNLPYALRHILIQIRSGVTLFGSFVSIAWGQYGTLAEEFRKTVNQINTGKSEVAALEEMAHNNPSLFFRRILWQMINAMKSGSDIGVVLKTIVENIALEQHVAIKKYGSQLNPLALFYMMLVVIFPTLGIVFMLILFSFVGSGVNVESLLMFILGFLGFVQIMFIGLIKNKRPAGI